MPAGGEMLACAALRDPRGKGLSEHSSEHSRPSRLDARMAANLFDHSVVQSARQQNLASVKWLHALADN